MTREARRSRLLRVVGVFLAGVAVGAGAAWWVIGARTPAPLGEGDEIFAAEPSAIREISVRSGSFWFSAVRWQHGQPFTAFVSQAPDNRAEQCTLGAEFSKALAVIASIRVKGTLPKVPDDRAGITLAVRGDGRVDPFETVLLLRSGPNKETVALIDGRAVTVGIPAEAIERFGRGCTAWAGSRS